MLDGQYGFEDICLGVPVVIGKKGIEQIIEIELSPEEKTKMKDSADGVRSVNDLLQL